MHSTYVSTTSFGATLLQDFSSLVPRTTPTGRPCGRPKGTKRPSGDGQSPGRNRFKGRGRFHFSHIAGRNCSRCGATVGAKAASRGLNQKTEAQARYNLNPENLTHLQPYFRTEPSGLRLALGTLKPKPEWSLKGDSGLTVCPDMLLITSTPQTRHFKKVLDMLQDERGPRCEICRPRRRHCHARA